MSQYYWHVSVKLTVAHDVEDIFSRQEVEPREPGALFVREVHQGPLTGL